MRIAVDYDGTITDDMTGQVRKEAITVLRKLHDGLGCELVLWSSRNLSDFQMAVSALESEGILQLFTLPSQLKNDDFGYCGKIIADIYLDDKAIFQEFDWDYVYEQIRRRM